MPQRNEPSCAKVLIRLAAVAGLTPSAYAAWTGELPGRARIWMAVQVGVWLLLMILNNILRDSTS